MDTIVSRLTVFFEEPFWVGVIEVTACGKLEAAKVTFGAEPKDCEIYNYFLKERNSLRFSPPVASEMHKELKINPKRMQRAISRQLDRQGVGTKAQQALKLQHELAAAGRKADRRQRLEDEKQRKFELKQQKRKEKHKGR